MTLKKALLVGINDYPGMPLRGCLNDVEQMRALLTGRYSFRPEDVRLLLDRDATAEGLRSGLAWLAEGGDAADAVRVFHFSGHGSQQADENGDEPDGRDEGLVPYDYRSFGLVTDDLLKQHYDAFPPAGNLTLVMDCCHSGTINRGPDEVRYRFMPVSYEAREAMDAAARRYREAQKAFIVGELRQLVADGGAPEDLESEVDRLMKGFDKKRFGDYRTREGNVLLAGCRSDQQAADAHIGGDFHGAFTYYLAQAIEQAGGDLTYGSLLQQTVDGLGAGNYGQVPQLECQTAKDKARAFSAFA
jgi:hypothetical protein